MTSTPHARHTLFALAALWIASAWAQETTVEVPEEIIPGESCVTADCHPDLAPGPDVHGPLNVGNCGTCHETVDNRHIFRDTREGTALCGLCHSLALGGVVHEPVETGDCTGCHDPHRSAIQPLLIQEPNEGLCMECHQDDRIMEREVLHGPVQQGLCIICHESHSSSNLHLVRQDSEDLCSFCHSQDIADISRLRHTHDPLTQGACLSCHDPHGGPTPALTNVAESDLCFTCHSAIEEQIEERTFHHLATHGNETCTPCHSAHGSNLTALLRANELELCLGCHDDEIINSQGEMIPDVATLIRTSRYLHGPVQDGNCTSCHQPHASNEQRLLSKPYPPEFYAPWEPERYELCFECHNEESFVRETTQTLTNFRRGSRNLHFVHVTKEERGRTCRACHAVHASNNPFHMSDSVPYGGWTLPINFEVLPGGGRCSPGCHQTETYSREAVTAQPAPESSQMAGGPAAE